MAKRIIIGLTTLFLLASPGQAQTISGTRIAAVVNNTAITVYELDNRMKFVFLTSRIANTKESRRRLAAQVLRRLVNESIQLQEAKRLRISVTSREIAQTIARIEKSSKMPVGGLFRTLRARGIDPITLVSQIRAAIAWQKVIGRAVSRSAAVGDGEIDDAIARIKANKDKTYYQLSEIYLPVDRSAQDGVAALTAQRLMRQIRIGASFAALARQFSQSSTAAQGGDMGIVFEGQLDRILETALKRVRPGQVIGPIRTNTGYYILLLRRRAVFGGATTPTRKAIRESLLRQKIDVRAQQYMRDLRRAAFVDIRV